MLRALTQLKNYRLNAVDGSIGRAKDFLFDDRHWTIRYMVADTGTWLPKRKVLISPLSLDEPDWASERLSVNLSRQQIENAPALIRDAPVSRRHELELLRYYAYPMYWGGPALWGVSATPYEAQARDQAEHGVPSYPVPEGDPHLRSAGAVHGYHLAAKDGEIGHVDEFIVDDQTWRIRYIIADTRKWLPGRKVVLAPRWAEAVDWASRRLVVDLTRAEVEAAPEYDPRAPVNLDYEPRRYDFHGRPAP